VLTLAGSMKARALVGGTAPAQVQRQVERHRARLAQGVGGGALQPAAGS